MTKQQIKRDCLYMQYGIYDIKYGLNMKVNKKTIQKWVSRDIQQIRKSGCVISIDINKYLSKKLNEIGINNKQYLLINSQSQEIQIHSFVIQGETILHDYSGQLYNNLGSKEYKNKIQILNQQIEWFLSEYSEQGLKLYQISDYPEDGLSIRQYIKYIMENNNEIVME